MDAYKKGDKIRHVDYGVFEVVSCHGENIYALDPGGAGWILIAANCSPYIEPKRAKGKKAELKPTNPKDAIGSDKLPLHLWPASATALGCLGLLDGALKYGRNNFREIGVRASIYADAAERHLKAWFEGEDTDPDSGLPHLAHALACVAILVDAQASDKLNDDRNLAGGYRKWLSALTPHVARLKKLREGMNPRHYTIKDNHE